MKKWKKVWITLKSARKNAKRVLTDLYLLFTSNYWKWKLKKEKNTSLFLSGARKTKKERRSRARVLFWDWSSGTFLFFLRIFHVFKARREFFLVNKRFLSVNSTSGVWYSKYTIDVGQLIYFVLALWALFRFLSSDKKTLIKYVHKLH